MQITIALLLLALVGFGLWHQRGVKRLMKTHTGLRVALTKHVLSQEESLKRLKGRFAGAFHNTFYNKTHRARHSVNDSIDHAIKKNRELMPPGADFQ